MKTSTSTPEAVPRLDEALAALCEADPITRPQRAQACLSFVPPMLRAGNLEELMERAVRFDGCGGFTGTPWDRPAHLRPRLWVGSFAADPPYPWFETLSTMRLLAIALGTASHADVDTTEARDFLERVLSLNPDKVLEGGTESSRLGRVRHQKEAEAVLQHVFGALPRLHLLEDIAAEVDDIMAQRPVWTHHVRRTLRLVAKQPGAHESGSSQLDRYVEAVLGPTPMSMRFRDPDEYTRALEADPGAMEVEAAELGRSLRSTGLACPQHGALLRLAARKPAILAAALGLDARGRSVLRHNAGLVAGLIEAAVRPATAQTAYGLARLLERGLLDREELLPAMQGLMALQVHPEVEDMLKTASHDGELDPAGILLGGVLRVLGQPLGVGQGNNPTCQSARGISLWAQYRPAHLISLLTTAARDHDLAILFNGETLHSSQLIGGLAPRLDPELDPVSLVLVPHLDRLYGAMMQRVAGRGEDGHRWVNPALYGQIVPPGFSTCFNAITWQVEDHPGFVRRFLATYHPDHNAGTPPVYATPVGIHITDDRGRHLGLHAVTLQRVERDDEGVLRVYFYNPNNEGRQDWGLGAVPSVRGHGEIEGESSLPLEHFASRLYAFHHPVRLPGEPSQVPDELVAEITQAARRTWGRAYPWPP